MTFKDELLEILKEEIRELEAIRNITYEKTDVIIKNKVEVLQNMTKEEEESIIKVASLEEKRLNLFNSWGVDKNTPFSEIIEKVPEGKEELVEIRHKLNHLLLDIQSRNNVNSQLIKENLEWMEFNLNLITQAGTPTTYGKKDRYEKSNESFFDRKV